MLTCLAVDAGREGRTRENCRTSVHQQQQAWAKRCIKGNLLSYIPCFGCDSISVNNLLPLSHTHSLLRWVLSLLQYCPACPFQLKYLLGKLLSTFSSRAHEMSEKYLFLNENLIFSDPINIEDVDSQNEGAHHLCFLLLI